MVVAFVAEKPSVAELIARAVGADRRDREAWRSDEVWVTWLRGHVGALAEPGEIDARWRRWTLEELPILVIPPWRIAEETRDRFEAAARVVGDPRVSRVVCATDAGREGELIFRAFAALSGLDKPVERLWVSSLTAAGLQTGLASMRPAGDFDGLARSAEARAWIDWWLGMNASRALSLTHDQTLSAGRVQTPTLAAVVDRGRAIAAHRPPLEVRVDVGLATDEAEFCGAGWRPEAELPEGLDFEPEDPRAGAAGLGSEVYVERSSVEELEVPPPSLFDLDGLQRAAHAAYGLTARRTLELAQTLYERRLLTYPRTDASHIGEAEAAELPELVTAVAARRKLTAPGFELSALKGRIIDASRVEDHPALLPTLRSPPPDLDEELARLLELVDRRLLAAVAAPARLRVTKVILQGAAIRVVARGEELLEIGSQAFESTFEPGSRIPELAPGEVVSVRSVRVREHREPPPEPFDDASLLAHMRHGRLGTAATRADVIEALIAKSYLVRQGPALEATALGLKLIDLVPERLKTPALTAELESELERLRRGEHALEALSDRARALTAALVAEIAGGAQEPLDGLPTPLVRLESAVPFPNSGPRCPELDERLCEGVDLEALAEVERRLEANGRARWAASPWLFTRHALLVARGYPAPCVIEHPHPALVDDEVMLLRGFGVRADRLHDALDAETREAVLSRYAAGEVEVLFTVGSWTLPRAPGLWVRDGDGAAGSEDAALLEFGLAPEPDAVWSRWGEALALEVIRRPRRRWAEALRSTVGGGPTLVLGAGAAETQAAAEALRVSAFTARLSIQKRREMLEAFLSGGPLLVADAEGVPPRVAFPGLRTLVLAGLPLGIDTFVERILGPSILEEEVRIVLLHEPDPAASWDALERRLPPGAALRRVVPAAPTPAAEVLETAGLEAAVGERLLERAEALGVVERSEDILRPGHLSLPDYADLRQQARASLDLLVAWSAEPECRLELLARAAGAPALEPCGVCDVCDPDGARGLSFRAPTEAERALMSDLLSVLARGGPAPRSRLRDAVGGRFVDGVLDALRSARLVRAEVELRGSREVRFFSLTEDGRGAPHLELVRLPVAGPS